MAQTCWPFWINSKQKQVVNRHQVGALLAACSALLILWQAGLPSSPQFVVQPLEGDLLIVPVVGGLSPRFEATTPDGRLTTFNPPFQQPIILNFWATWCEPCLREMPLLDDAHAQGIQVVGINAGLEAPEDVQAWVATMGISYPVVMDDRARTIEGLYRVRGLPTTFFINSDGIIRQVTTGELTEESLSKGLAAIAANQ